MVTISRPPAPDSLAVADQDWRTLPRTSVLWRAHRTAGPNVVAWDQLRYWGPSAARFDPHEPPPSAQDIGVSYAALNVATSLAEVFQDRRVINTVRHSPYLTAWQPRRSLRLLDLTGTWPVRNGASHALNTGRHDFCRAWARAIYKKRGSADGLFYSSATTGQPSVVLWTAAKDSFPKAPSFSRALSDPAVRPFLQAATDEIGYRLL